MKTIFKHIIISLLIIVGISAIFFSCHKDPTYPVVVTVKKLIDTSKVVSGATVTIVSGQSGKLQKAVGVTDANGQFNHTFSFDAILQITVELKTDSIDSLYGTGLVQLLPNQTAFRTVLVK